MKKQLIELEERANLSNPRYKQTLNDLQKTIQEKALLQKQCDSLNDRLKESNDKCNSLQKENTSIKMSLREKESALNADMKKLVDKSHEDESKISMLQGQYNRSVEKIENLEKLCNNLKNNNEYEQNDLVTSNEELRNECRKLNELKNDYEKRLNNFCKEYESITAENNEIKSQLQKSIERQEKLERKNSELKSIQDVYKDQCAEAKKTNKDLQDKLAALEYNIKSMINQREIDAYEARKRRENEFANELSKNAILKEMKGKITQFRNDRLSPRKPYSPSYYH